MPRVNIYLPEELAERARETGLSVSSLAQAAIIAELDRNAIKTWLDSLPIERSLVSHDDVMMALDAARAEFGGGMPVPLEPVVVDASALVDLLVGTDRAAPVGGRLRHTAPHAPGHVDADVLSVLGRLNEAGLLSAADVDAALSRLVAVPLVRHPVAGLSVGAWGRREQLRPVDALYVEPADRLGIALITTDPRLARTCTQAEGGEGRPRLSRRPCPAAPSGRRRAPPAPHSGGTVTDRWIPVGPTIRAAASAGGSVGNSSARRAWMAGPLDRFGSETRNFAPSPATRGSVDGAGAGRVDGAGAGLHRDVVRLEAVVHIRDVSAPAARRYRSQHCGPDGGFAGSMQFCMLNRMQSTSVRIDIVTHRELKQLAAELGTSVGETLTLAVRRLRQDRIGQQLTAELTSAERSWLDADLG